MMFFWAVVNTFLLTVLIFYFMKRTFSFFHSRGVGSSSGSSWKSRKFGDKYVVSVNNRAELGAALADFARKNAIEAGTVSGIGAVDSLTLRFFNPETKLYEDKTFNEQMEIANLTGNISVKDGDVYLHLHATAAGKDYQAVAGHLLSGFIRGAGEFVVDSFPDGRMDRFFSEETGLNMYDFDR